MTSYERARRVQVILGESDHVGHQPRHQAMLEYLRAGGAAGATVVRGVAGFGHHSRIHTANVLRLSLDLPMVLIWVDTDARVEALLPGLIELAGSGLVTVEPVQVARYGSAEGGTMSVAPEPTGPGE
jgi:PII-like signaling protein